MGVEHVVNSGCRLVSRCSDWTSEAGMAQFSGVCRASLGRTKTNLLSLNQPLRRTCLCKLASVARMERSEIRNFPEYNPGFHIVPSGLRSLGFARSQDEPIGPWRELSRQ